MPFFAGLASGFNSALVDSRAQEAELANRQADRDNQTLQLIATQHPDPEVRAGAMGSLLTQVTGKRSKGLAGLFQEFQRNPMVPHLRELMASGTPMPGNTTAAPTMQEKPAEGSPEAPDGAAALPSRSLVAPVAGPPGPTGAPSVATVPRASMRTPPETAGATAYAEKRGALSGTLDAVSNFAGAPPGPDGAGLDQTTRAYAIGHALGLPSTRTTDAEGKEHFFIGNQEVGSAEGVAKPVAAAAAIKVQADNLFASGRYPTYADAEAAARSGAAGALTAKQTTAEQGPQTGLLRQQALREQILNEQATRTGTTLSNDLKQRTLNGQLTAKEAYGVVGQLLNNRPDATTDMANEWVQALTAHGGGTAATPPPAAPAAPAALGAPAAPAAVAPPSGAAAAPAAAPGLPSGRSLYKPNADEQKALDVITSARPMMQRAQALIDKLGAGDNSLGGKVKGIKNTVQSKLGFNPSDPVYQELLPLLNHIRVYALSPYLHGIRAGAFIGQLQANSPEDADLPALMTRKLTNLEQNFEDIEQGIGTGKQPPAASGPPNAAAAGGHPATLTTPPPSGPAAITRPTPNAPARATATAAPPEVQQALQGVGVGKHTLSDGSVWNKAADGTITKVQ